MGRIGQGLMRGAGLYNERNLADRNAIVKEYLWLVKRVALHMKARLPAHVSLDDLIQSGMVGLIDAVQSYKNENSAAFETYAVIRIRGEMIDSLRLYDWTPRSVHQNSRAIRDAEKRLSNSLGRPPTDSEMAAELQVSLDKYHQMRLECVNTKMICLNDASTDEDDHPIDLPAVDPLTGMVDLNDAPFESVASAQFRSSLVACIKKLPEREQLVISMYYTKELNLREIGLAMGLSESRVCQLLAGAQERLRELLGPLWSEHPNAVRGRKSAQRKEQDGVARKTRRMKSSLFADDPKQDAETEQGAGSCSAESSYDGAEDAKECSAFRGGRDPAFEGSLSARFFAGDLDFDLCAMSERQGPDLSEKLKLPYNIHSSRPALIPNHG